MRLGIRSRLILGMLSVAAIVLAASLGFGAQTLAAYATEQTTRELENAVQAVQLVLTLQQDQARAEAETLALQTELSEAVAAGDRGKLIALTRRFRNGYDVDYVVVTDAEGVLLAAGQEPDRQGDDLSDLTIVDRPLRGIASATILRTASEPLMIAGGAPVYAAVGPTRLVGAVVVGRLLDQTAVEELKASVGKDISFVVDGKRLFSTLPAAGVLAALPPAESSPTTFEIADQTYQAIGSPLVGRSGGSAVGYFEVAAPKAFPRAALAGARTGVAYVLLPFLVLVVALAVGLSSYLTRPLARLAAAVLTWSDDGDDRQVDVLKSDGFERLQRAVEELAASSTLLVAELEYREQVMAGMNQMADLLESCRTAEEAYIAIAQLVQLIFPDEMGALYVTNSFQNLVIAVAVWNGKLHGNDVFLAEDCLALRRSRFHLVNNARTDLICNHYQFSSDEPHFSYIDIPLIVHSEVLGVLHLGRPGQGRWTEFKQQLAVTVAQYVALALALLKLQESLRSQVVRDSLTGLFNRRYMEESLTRELHRATRNQHSLGIIMLDIDGLKRCNNAHGHAAGNALLREFGAFLRTQLRAEDIVCRYGGEEFALILPDAALSDTYQRAEQLREQAKQMEVRHRGVALEAVTISLGVAVFPAHGVSSEELLRAASIGLNRAKAEGRDCVVIAPEAG